MKIKKVNTSKASKSKIIKKEKTNNKKLNIKDKIKSKDKVDKRIKKEKRNIFLIILISIMILIMATGLIFILYIIFNAPEFDQELLYSTESSILYTKDGEEFARIGPENRELVTYNELPQVLVDAIVATEDSRFFQHSGFDIARFIKASLGQLAGNDAGGASTLTMQIVKTVYTDPTLVSGLKGIIRKFTDIYMAIFKVEKQYTKEEIIEFYVNYPYLGEYSYGVEQASQTYFGKSVKDLSLPEAALIAGLFNAPNLLNPYSNPEGASERRDTVLDLMYRHGYITEEQMNDAKSISVQSLLAGRSEDNNSNYQWFIDTVVEEIKNDVGINAYNGGLKIYTTLNPSVQDELVNMANGAYTSFNDYEQVAVAVTDVKDGSITAVYGGRNQTGLLSYNRATQMFRHPGSTAKPIFDYGPLIEYNGASTGTYFLDEPMSYSNGQGLKNSDGKYLGLLTMRTALARSRNIPAVQAFQQVDKNKIVEFVHNLGIDYGDELYESASIGAFDGTSPLQLSAAYAAFGRGGYYIEPYSYTKIVLLDTNEEIEQKPKIEKVMSDATAYLINNILLTAQNTYSVGGSFKISGTDVASKTGTSTYEQSALEEAGVPLSASRDNWTISYSPDYSISLWYGYDHLMSDYYTDSVKAANKKGKMMAGMAKKIFPKNSRFEVPSSVVKVEVEKETVPLQLASQYTPSDMRIEEYFKVGTEPTEVSNRYNKLDAPTNGKANTNGNTIYLSWDGIDTPDAINPDYLLNYFNDNYIISAEKYYNNRISYNNTKMGYLLYKIYLENNGTLQYVGETTDTSFAFQGEAGTSYKFIIKSAYSIFTANESDGLTINAKTEGTSGNIEIKFNGKDECITKSYGYYEDSLKKPVTVTDLNGNDITSKVTVSSKITNMDNNTTVSRIDTSVIGKYQITYTVKYNNKNYEFKRIVSVSETCSQETTE